MHHPDGIRSDLSSCWTSKPWSHVRYEFGPNSLERSGSSKSLCSTLERLLAWENNLYQGVKVVVAVYHFGSFVFWFLVSSLLVHDEFIKQCRPEKQSKSNLGRRFPCFKV